MAPSIIYQGRREVTKRNSRASAHCGQRIGFEMGTSMRGISAERPLSEEELDQLSDFLTKMGPSALNLEAVDGLFCALICGTEMVLPSEYLPQIWGEEFVFDSQSDVDRVIGLLMRHWNTIAGTLRRTLKAHDVYMPILFVGDDGVTRGNDWAQGFMRGVLIRPRFWRELMQSDDELLLPIMLLAHECDPDPAMRPSPVPPEKREDIVMAMIASLVKIYRHFEPFRRSIPPSAQTPPQRRTGVKIGRNDLCPCGSGKKYKRCCAADAPTMH
jgi:uncharacterized protein